MLQSDAEPAINVVICVHDALPDVRACLNALAATDYPEGSFSITIVDDGSSEATAACLRDFSRDGRAQLIRHDEALGYTAAANAGIRARGDVDYVVLLNSDTIVPPAWLRRLLVPFAEVPDLGLAGPVSNAASWQSIPDIRSPAGGWAVNPLPPGWSVERMDSLVHGLAQADAFFPRVPVLNGFCLMVRADLFDQLGLLDEANFPRGYGEENDFCFRASDAGYGLVVATNCYVFHAKSKSFGSEERNRLAHAGKERLAAKYNKGRLDRASATMREQPVLAELRARVGVLLPGGKGGSSAPISVSRRRGDDDVDAASINAAAKLVLESGATGMHPLSDNVTLEILEPMSTKRHEHIKGSCPDSATIEDSFNAGPVFAVGTHDAIIDTEAGLTLLDGGVVRTSTVSRRLANRYQPDSAAIAKAEQLEGLMLPVASQRMENYSRWWLDSLAKLFVSSRTRALSGEGATTAMRIAKPELPFAFQRDTLALLADSYRFESGLPRYLRGKTLNTPGLSFASSQNIGGLVTEFASLLRDLPAEVPDLPNVELVYVSRKSAQTRRVTNEETLLPVLRKLGFAIVHPDELSVAEQIARFRQARVVVAPHGSGLTNMLFCKPGSTIVEIFPEGGVHGSTYLRLASHLRFDYYFVVAPTTGEPPPKDNPIDADITLDIDATAGFLREVV